MRACVVVFPGSNADTEMIHTLRHVCGVPTAVAWHTDVDLPAGTDLVAIPGGFAYGDYLRAGAIAKVSPVIRAIRAHAARGGWVLGVCNGFQILTEAGLLLGALTRNVQQRFACGDFFVKVTAEGPFTGRGWSGRSSPGGGGGGGGGGGATETVWRLPIAHGEGRYQASEETMRRLEGEGLIGLRYCTQAGEITDAANPNGSIGGIAGIYGGPRKNIFGLMPHPERMSEAITGGDDGKRLFVSLLANAA
jgi:phosphoribosylformylglycinamidine (FGAM) synthase-like amidotransferase family enzyme